MNKKSRYLLIGLCVAVFLVLTPLMVLYARGVTYDFKTNRFVMTGILSVRSQPQDAQIWLDGKLKSSHSGDIRFLTPDEYQVTLKKTGYQDWSKRLEVKSGQVTWANAAFSNIFLFFSQPPTNTVATDVEDFYSQGDGLDYIKDGSFVSSSISQPTKKSVYALPNETLEIAAADDAGKNFALTNRPSPAGTPTILFVDTASGQVSDIGKLFADTPKLGFDDNGRLYALDNHTLYSIDPSVPQKTALFTNINAFAWQGGNLYLVRQEAGLPAALLFSQGASSQTQTLISGLPEAAQEQLYITFERQIFLLADGTLYLANTAMQQLAGGVTAVNFDRPDSILTVFSGGELDYAAPVSFGLNFITRSSQGLADAEVRTAVGYAFFLQDNQINAIELDSRDRQNQYLLYQGGDIKKMAPDGAGQNLIVLDGGNLKIVKVR